DVGLMRSSGERPCPSVPSRGNAKGAAAPGPLQLYRERMAEPLSRIRSTPEKGLMSVHLRPSQTIVLLGGYVPHATAAMEKGQKRIISVLCFRAIAWV